MLLNLKTTATAALTALALTAGAAAPVQAFGSNERKFLQGLAAAVIIGAVINESNRNSRKRAQPDPEPQRQSRRPRPHVEPRQDQYHQSRRDSAPQAYDQPQQGRVIGSRSSNYSSGLYDTPTARAFNSYSPEQRRAVQRRLAGFGYYGGAIDGSFGPRTHQALYEFARTANKQAALDSTSGSYQVIDALLS